MAKLEKEKRMIQELFEYQYCVKIHYLTNEAEKAWREDIENKYPDLVIFNEAYGMSGKDFLERVKKKENNNAKGKVFVKRIK